MFADAAPPRSLRVSLGLLLAFLALNAWAGGFYGMSGAPGVPVEWLRGSPFDGYFVPGLLLFFVVGGAFAVAAAGVFTNWRFARHVALVAALVLAAWITAQMAMIGYVSWMQPLTGAVAAVVAVMAWCLPREGTKRYLLDPRAF